MQAVGESVKKLYSDIMEDLLPPNEKVGIELSMDKRAEAGLCKKPFQVCSERHVKTDTKQATEDSRIDHGVDNVATLATAYNGTSKADASFMPSLRSSISSPSRQIVGRMDVKSNLPVNDKMAATKIIDETTLAETTLAGTNACIASQSCETSNQNQNQNHGVPWIRCETYFSDGIENDSTTQSLNYPVLVKSAGEKQIDTISSPYVSFAEPVGEYFSISWL